MPRKRKDTPKARRPIKRQRLEGLTVTVQNCKTKGYSYSVVMHSDRQRIRQKYCRTKEEAEGIAQKWGIEAGNTGAVAALNITDHDKRALMQWKEDLGKFGKKPADAVAFYLDHLKRCRVSMSVQELFEKVVALKRREKKSERYLTDLVSRMARFCASFGPQTVADITTSDISTWLHSLEASPVTINNYRRLISVLFSHAVRIGACERNPVEGVDPIKQSAGEVGILTVEQASKLLSSAAGEPEILAAIVIGLFAGVRDAELKRMDWREVNLESGYIEIKASKSKSARRRLIEMQPVLKAWLEKCPGKSGAIWPMGERGRVLHERVRRVAGFGTPVGETQDEDMKDEKKIIPWPHNALRHSFASYHLAKFKNAQNLALEMGHTSTAILFEHYRELVQPNEADAFWSLFPPIG
jgi:integrase